MLSIGTYFLVGGKLYARISSVTFPPEIYTDNDQNQTFIWLALDIEIWNPSILTRIVYTPNLGFTIVSCIDVTFTYLSGYNSHVIITHIPDQTYGEEYIYLMDTPSLPLVGRMKVNPGLSTELAYFGMMFNEVNLTRLPLGEYQMWMKIKLRFGEDIITNAVTMHVFENETFVEYDTISESWGLGHVYFII